MNQIICLLLGLLSISTLMACSLEPPTPTATPYPQSIQLDDCEDIESREPLDELSQRVWPGVVRVGASPPGGVTISSGFIRKIDERGVHILASYHAIKDSPGVVVCFFDGRSYGATVHKFDEAEDWAALRVCCPKGLTALPMGLITSSEYGDKILVAGYPTGSMWRFDARYGVVERELRCGPGEFTVGEVFTSRKGNSGGPVVSMTGEVLGMIVEWRENSDGRFFCAAPTTSRGM